MNEVVVKREQAVGLRDAFTPKTFTEAMEFAGFLAKSGMIPFAFQDKPDDILSAMMLGAEVGLRPMQALQNIAVINGRPSIFGDSAKAIVMASPLCEGIEERFDKTDPNNPVAVCVCKRRGSPDIVSTFSWEDAQRAGLAGKTGPWTQYPMRMLQMRARSFGLRDQFPDVLSGLSVYEEVIDIPAKGGEKSFGTAPEMPAKDVDEVPVAEVVDSVEEDAVVIVDDVPENIELPEDKKIDIIEDLSGEKSKLDEIIERLGGEEKCSEFLRKKKTLRDGKELSDLLDAQVERLYNNLDKMVELQKEEEA